MTRHYIPRVSALVLATFAGAAWAGELPASGEQPFAESSLAASGVTRAEVMAVAIATPPVSGEMSGIATPASMPSDLSRATVVAELRDALSHGFRVSSGESG